MRYILRALSAELLKTRRTLAVWMTLVTPLVVCVLQTLVLMRWQGEYGGEKINAWTASMSNVLNLWAILALPLFITLETALLAQTEHSEKHWKHLFTLAVPRWVYYAAKWLVGAGLIFLGQVFLLGGTLLSGYLMRLARPDLGFDALPPVGWMAGILGLVFLISLLIHSIHTWVAMHFHSFTVAVGVGMAAAVANIILISSSDGRLYFPWTLSIHALPAADGANLPYALAVGIAGGLLLALLGGWEVTRRDIL